MELSEFINPTIELEIKEVKIQAKKANLKDIAEIASMYSEGMHDSQNILISLKGIWLCVRKCMPEVTEDQIADLFDLTNTTELNDTMIKLGFIPPTVQESKPKKDQNGE